MEFVTNIETKYITITKNKCRISLKLSLAHLTPEVNIPCFERIDKI